jgi:hypothetical protein
MNNYNFKNIDDFISRNRKFALLPTMSPDGNQNTYTNNEGKIITVNDATPITTEDGKQMIKALDNTGNEVFVDNNDFQNFKPIISTSNV